MRRFALEFSGAAEGLGFNEAALKDLFNSALDEPLNCWRIEGPLGTSGNAAAYSATTVGAAASSAGGFT